MHKKFIFAVSLLLFTTVFAQETPSSLHLDWLNKKINPATDFFAYANGGWQQKNAIPAAYPSWNNFRALDESNTLAIKNILIATAKNTQNTPGSIEQKVGDFYFSGMDEKTINTAGIKPVQPEFERIQRIQSTEDLQNVIAHLHAIGVSVLFDFGQMQDYQDSNQVIGVVSQGGLGLPDRDYYLKNDARFQKIRQAYLQHVTNMFILLGDTKKVARAEAATVLRIETGLARSSMNRIAMRDPRAIYHPIKLAALQKITPNFSWKNYFTHLQHAEIQQINLATPLFFKALNIELEKVSLTDWKTYLRWHLLSSLASSLSEPFVKENFKMTQTLTGVKEQLPRWKRVVHGESAALGFAIGELYVKKMFPPSSKQQVEEMIKNIRAALRKDLQNLSWMDAATRQAALHKLDKMQAKVGYPEKWWDYSTLKIDRGPYVLNVLRASEFLTRRELNKIGKPVDRDEWQMTPQTVNAYYEPSLNQLKISAGILQPPFFDPSAPAAVNYGAIGFVIGHEITHGFDDQGAQFDEKGNLKNWWSANDLQAFQQKTSQIAAQFSDYTIDGKTHVQGKLVMGEAAADLGGLKLAYRALHSLPAFDKQQTIAGFSPDQQFFLSAAHVWASNIRPEEAQRLVLVDPHPPARYRVNGTLANMKEFKMAYGIAADSVMVNQNCPIIW